VRRFKSPIASPSSRRWSSVEDLLGSGLVSSVRARGSVKLIASIRSRGTPFDSIRHNVVIHNAAWSPLPWAKSTGGNSAAPGAARGACANAGNPKPPAAKGKIPAPCNSIRRDRFI
jgi:hypothetical protein